MAQSQNGSTVKIHYTGTLNDGTVFDSSIERDPLEFTIGSGQVIPGFDKAVTGMEVNEKKSIDIPAAEAYGDRNDELIIKIPATELPADLNPQIGQQLQMQHPSGQQFFVIVTDISDETVSLDANHPLAGQDLNFDIELVEIVS